MIKKIIALTTCEDRCKERFGFYKLINSWNFFHPDIPIYNWGDEETNRIKKENPGICLTSYMPIAMLEAKRRYDANLVIKLDADSIILDRLTEIIDCEDDVEIFSVRNDNDSIGNRDERHNRPMELWNLPNEKYVNCGCVATTSESFLKEWIFLNDIVVKRFGGVKEFWMCEQNTMNIVFHSGKYKTRILDEKGGNLFYGASANMHSENKRDPDHIIREWGINTWKSWQDITYNEKDKKFYLYNKIVKILHQAGGGKVETAVKLSFDMFNQSIVPILKNITNAKN